MAGLLREFKDFVSRGNVLDLAVAVVIGTAFTRIVNAVVSNLVTPLVGMVGNRDYSQLEFTVRESTFGYGHVINAAIQFVLIAAVLFFLVIKPINVLNERRSRGEEPEPPSPPTDEAVLLAEIRDLLRMQQGFEPAGRMIATREGDAGPEADPDPGRGREGGPPVTR